MKVLEELTVEGPPVAPLSVTSTLKVKLSLKGADESTCTSDPPPGFAGGVLTSMLTPPLKNSTVAMSSDLLVVVAVKVVLATQSPFSLTVPLPEADNETKGAKYERLSI